MSFPRDRQELRAAGYAYCGPGRCEGCGEVIEWWRCPSGKTMPIVTTTCQPHFADCPDAANFRRKKALGGAPK